MLRASLLRARPAARPLARAARPQWHAAARRCYADEKKPGDTAVPNPAPSTSPSPSEAPKQSSAPESEASRSTSTAQPATTPPTGPGSASIGPDPVKAPKPKKKGRLRRLLFNLILLSGLGYAGGVYYSLVSDNFHDFFTEYVPFAEDAVGYFEEREFRKRFPGRAGQPRLHPQVSGENKVTIPGKSGLTSRVAEDEGSGSDLNTRGPHVSAVDGNVKSGPDTQSESPKAGSSTSAKGAQEQKKVDAQKEKPGQSGSHKLLPRGDSQESASAPSKPIVPIDHLNVPAASEPVVQDVVKIVNDIITTINSDPANGSKYDSTLEKAKSDLSKVVADINLLKANLDQSAEEKIKSAHGEFDSAAKELVQRLQEQMADQETSLRGEWENERERLSQTYKEKMRVELKAAQDVYEQKLKNELLEQSIQLQKSFAANVRQRVEAEREGRLGKLNELSSSVHELESLTTQWNQVVDANLKTQHLVVAVEAVKSALDSQVTPKPFITELAALKEIAADDPVVSAAIASINPAAYQRGIPNSAHIIDRFRRVADQVRKAALLPEDAGVASHLASVAMSKVLFKKSGLAVGQDVEAVLARTEVLLEEGDLDAATREMNGLQGWAKVLSKDWLGECRRVLEVRQALDVIGTEARLQSLRME